MLCLLLLNINIAATASDDDADGFTGRSWNYILIILFDTVIDNTLGLISGSHR